LGVRVKDRVAVEVAVAVGISESMIESGRVDGKAVNGVYYMVMDIMVLWWD
jgi:hypothetical protein